MTRRALLVLLVASCRSAIDIDTAQVPFACGADTDCNAPWRCAMTGVCFDPRVRPKSTLSCATNTQCANGWRCSQPFEDSARCIEVGVGVDVRCVDDTGCEGGWRCGFDGRCFNPKSPRDAGVGCSSNAQCTDDSRCGQRVHGARTCVSNSVGGPNPCDDDDGCSGGWRCNTVTDTCVLVTDTVSIRDQFLPKTDIISPAKRLVEAPTAFTMSQVESSQEYGSVASAAMYFANSGIEWVLVSRNERGLVPHYVDQRSVPIVPRAFVATPGRLFVLDQDGGLTAWAMDGGVTVLDAGGPVLGLRCAAALSLPRKVDAIAWTATEISTFNTDGSRSSVPADAGLLDVVNLDGVATVLAAPVRAPRNVRVGRIGPNDVIIFQDVLADGRNAMGMTQGRSPAQFTRACPDGASPSQFWLGTEVGEGPAALMRCPMAAIDGGALIRQRFSGDDWRPYYEDQVPWQFGEPVLSDTLIGRAHASRGMRFWFTHPDEMVGGSVLNAPLQPMVLDRQPDTIVAIGDQGVAQAGGWQFNFDRSVGFVSNLAPRSSKDFKPLFVVPGNPNWVITSNGVIDLTWRAVSSSPRILAQTPADVTWTAPLSAATTNVTIEGVSRSVLLVAAGDTVWLADVTEARKSQFAPPVQLEPIVVPSPGLRLRSMSLPPRMGPNLLTEPLDGYVTTTTQVFRLSSRDLVRWAATSISQPATPALPVEVWSEGFRGRLGMSDGTIWSLPIMVKLARPIGLPDGGLADVVDFVRMCDSPFVSTQEGIWGLERVDGGLPAWVPRNVLSLELDATRGARFYETGTADAGQYFVATVSGRVVELSPRCR